MKRYILPSAARWRERGPKVAHAMDRARALPVAAPGLGQQLRDALGLEMLPWAAALARAHGLTLEPGAYLGIELLSLRPEPNGVYVIAAGDFVAPSALHHARAWLEPWLREEGCGAWQLAGSTWLARLDASMSAPACDHGDGVLGVELSQVMPESLVWQRRLNEAQMVLREQAETLNKLAPYPINSAWYFDAGTISALPPVLGRPAPRGYFSQDPGTMALLAWFGSEACADPGPAEWIDLRALDVDSAETLWLDAPGDDYYACGARMRRSLWDRFCFWRGAVVTQDFP